MKTEFRLVARNPDPLTPPRPDTIYALTLLAFLSLIPAPAYPPAPHHLIYGFVRDEFGNPVSAKDAEVSLQMPTGGQIKAAIVPQLEPGANYRLPVPMDAGLTQDLYKPAAMQPTLPFKLMVRIGNKMYLPIEMTGLYSRMGQPAQSTRIDLTLGEDSDGDGLPDAWERALITASGGARTLKDIRPGDDFDGDGLSNLQEYIAGTYAFDDKDGFSLKAIRKSGERPVLEFLAIRNRTYTIVGSVDLQDWSAINLRVLSNRTPGPFQASFQATDTRPIQVEVQPQAGTEMMRFYKLMVQ